MLRKLKRRIFIIFAILCAFGISSCGDPSEDNYYYVSNGVSLTKSQAENFEHEFELSGSRLQEIIDVPLDESAYTAYQKEWENEPFPEAKIWSTDITAASGSIEKASEDLKKRSDALNESLDEEAEK